MPPAGVSNGIDYYGGLRDARNLTVQKNKEKL